MLDIVPSNRFKKDLIDVVNLPKSVLARDIGRFTAIMGGICEMCFGPVDDRYDIS